MTEHLKEAFIKRIIELQARVDSIHNDFASGRDADWAEQAGERENDDVLNGLEAEAKIEIQQLSNAITRIEDGSYGICAQCGKKIAEARLAAQPAATKCIVCAD